MWRSIHQPAGAAEERDKEEDGALLSRGEGSEGDAGRRAAGGEEEGAGETNQEGERAAAGEEAQGGLDVVWR